MKLAEFKNGALVTLERNAISGMYTVILRNPAGAVHDKVSCDTRRVAFEYFRALKLIARNL
jgi:hypothetical protein